MDDAGTLFSYCSDSVDQKSLVGSSEPQFTFREPPLKSRRSSAFAELSVCAGGRGVRGEGFTERMFVFTEGKVFAAAAALKCVPWHRKGTGNIQQPFRTLTIWGSNAG